MNTINKTSRVSSNLLVFSWITFASALSGQENKTQGSQPVVAQSAEGSTFSSNVDFLETHVEVAVLGKPGGPQIVVVPEWQGRVMDSTTSGRSGNSHGWINYDLISEGVREERKREGLQKHIHAFGGEDRFWIGPEGGQYSWYFKSGSEFTFLNWKVPSFIDTAPWEVVDKTDTSITVKHQQELKNWSDVPFNMTVERQIALLTTAEVEKFTGVNPEGKVKMVAYESRNKLVNSGNADWTKKTGLPSIWILGMLESGEETQVVIPLQKGKNDGPFVKDDYFGKVPTDRLKVDEKKGVLYFTADGKYRSKIGISPIRSTGVAGSWNSEQGILTIVQYNMPDTREQYVNSAWEHQENPFEGDAVNSYNDGPVDGDILGPFYELETSSPALSLAPGEDYTHIHRTMHFEGDRKELDKIAQYVLGVSLDEVEANRHGEKYVSFEDDALIEVGDPQLIYKLPFAYDHTVIYNSEEKKWHLFGIPKDTSNFIHLTTDSLTGGEWEEQMPFIHKGEAIWAPHIVFHDNLYYMFYTSIGTPRQIRYAVTRDLYDWEHPSYEPLFAYRNEQSENLKTKDPMVFWDENKEQWIMYHSMLKDDRHWVVGYSTSRDLVSWAGPEICFDEQTTNPNVESPFVVKRGEYYYLLLSARPWPKGGQDFFRSKTPHHWEASNLVARENPWHAGEIVQDLDGRWYLTRSSGEGEDFRIGELIWKDGYRE